MDLTFKSRDFREQEQKQAEQSGGEGSTPGEGWWQLRLEISSRGGEKRPNLGYILKIELTIFHEELEVGCERRAKVKGDSIFWKDRLAWS